MSEKYIVIKYHEAHETYEVFSKMEDLLTYVVQEKLLGAKISVFKFGECVGDFS